MWTGFVAPNLAASWVRQLMQLHSSLANDPTNSRCWFWQIRIKVLLYLVSRYGVDPDLDDRIPPRHPLPTARRIPPLFGGGEPARSRQELQRMLQRIADLNHDDESDDCSRD